MKAKSKKACYASKGLPKVPGKPRGTDIIPAWLTPGEAVLSPGAAEMLGRGNVQALNQAASTLRLGTPQYKAEGEDEMQPAQPDYAMLGNQRAAEILSNSNLFNRREVTAANRYMDPAGLAGGPSLARDQAFLGGTRSLESVNNPMDEALRRQTAQAQQGLFGGTQRQPQRFEGDDGVSEGLQAAQEAVGSALSYGKQAAQDAIREGQQARYMSQGGIVERLGTVQPGYYAVGTAYAGMGAQNMLEDALRNQGMGRAISDSKALVPAGPRTSMPTGMLGEGQGIKVMQNGLGTGPVRIPSSAIPQAVSTSAPTFNGRVGGFSVPEFEPFKAPGPAPSALSNARGAINAGATPIGDLASSAAKSVGNVASKAAGTLGNLAKNTAVGAARVGPAFMGLEGAVRGLNTPTEDYAKRIGIDTPTSMPGQLGVRALGVLSDVGASGLGMLGIDQRGKFADVAAQRAQQANVMQPANNPASPAVQTAPSRVGTAQPASSSATTLMKPVTVDGRTFTDQASADAAAKQLYYQEGLVVDGNRSYLTPSQAQNDFVKSGRPMSSLSKDELYKIYPGQREVDARVAFYDSERASYQKKGLPIPFDLQTPEQKTQTMARENAMAQRQAQQASTIGYQMAGLNMNAQRQAQDFMQNALTVLNNPARYTDNQKAAALAMLQSLSPIARQGIETSDKFYSTDANRGKTAAEANKFNSEARLNNSNASLTDEKVRQERLGLTPNAGMRLGSGQAKANDPGKYYSVDTGIDTLGNIVVGPNGQAYRIDAQSNSPVPVNFPQPQTPAQLFSRFNSAAELIAWARSQGQKDKYSDVSDEALANEWNKVQQAR